MTAIPANVAQYMTKGSTDVNQPDDRKDTPLSKAITAKDFEAVKYLVENKADVNLPAKKIQVPPIVLASRTQNVEIVKFLLQHGADVNKKSSKGESALHAACKYGPVDVIKCLVENKAELNPHNDGFWTPVSIACKNLDLACIKFLVENGADAKLNDTNDNSTVGLAMQSGKYDVATFLLEKGVPVNFKKTNLVGQSPLHLAAEGGCTKCVDLCLEKGSDLARKDQFNNTALDNACWAGDLNMIKHLVSKGAKLESANKSKNTLLNIYLMSDKEPTVEGIKYFQSVGIDVNQANVHGNTALSIAEGREWKAAADYLKSIKAVMGKPL